MRSIYLILPLFFLVQFSFAQDSTFKELGLNATPFVNQYLDFGSGNGEFSSPYMITYEQKFGKLGGRIGLGLVSKNTSDKPTNDEPSEPTFNQNNTSLDARLGAVLYMNLSNRWSLKYGIDALIELDRNKNWTVVRNLFGQEVTNTNSVNQWNSGIAPFVFVQFHITKQFSLATELLGNATYGEKITKTESSEFPDFNTRQETTEFKFNIAPPTALYFIFRF